MKRKLIRVGGATATMAWLALSHLARPARVALADDDAKGAYGITSLGETCGGKCSADVICCKIVVVQPAPPP
jgi:hypothetical protein